MVVDFLETSHILAFLLDCPVLAGPSPPLLLSPDSIPRLPAPLARCSPHPPRAHRLFSQLCALVHALPSAVGVLPLLLSSSSTWSARTPLTPTPTLCCRAHWCVTSSRSPWRGLPLICLQVSLSQAWPRGAQGQRRIICLCGLGSGPWCVPSKCVISGFRPVSPIMPACPLHMSPWGKVMEAISSSLRGSVGHMRKRTDVLPNTYTEKCSPPLGTEMLLRIQM